MRSRRSAPLSLALVAVVLAVAACSGGGSSAGSAARQSGSAAPSVPASPTGPPTEPSTPAASGSPAPATTPLAWKGCRDGFQCATLTVPLDYANPGGATVSLRLIRLKAGRPSTRIGSLLVNPGGPGVSAVDFLRSFADGSAPEELRRRFDLVAFDPRGTTGSTPVRCLDTAALDAFFHVDPDPDSPGEITALDRSNRAFAAGCQKRSGRVLAHVSTDVAARDMDSVRAALGEAKLTYLGYSYGTSLGAAYLDRFPTKVRAMVLDGALDPRLSWDQVLTGQGKGFEQAFQSFLAWCDRNAAQCRFRKETQGSLAEAYDRIAAQVEQEPLPTGKDRKVGPAELSYGAGQALYSTSYWPFLGSALADAAKDDGASLLTLSDLYLERDANGYDNTIEANFAVNCVDRPWPKDLASYQRLADQLGKTAPRFGPAIAWSGSACAVWPVPSTGKPHVVRAASAPPVVVIGTTRDPATPYAWAVGLADQLDKGVLITFDGDGHTAYRRGAPVCITEPVTAYSGQREGSARRRAAEPASGRGWQGGRMPDRPAHRPSVRRKIAVATWRPSKEGRLYAADGRGCARRSWPTAPSLSDLQE